MKIEFYGVTGSDNGGDGVFSAIHLIRSRQTGERMAGGYRVDDSDADDFEDLEDDLDDLSDDDGDDAAGAFDD